jgi:hypothetical protein
MNAIPVSSRSNSPAWCVDFLSGVGTDSRNVVSGVLSGALVGDGAAVPVLEGVAVLSPGEWSSEHAASDSAMPNTIHAPAAIRRLSTGYHLTVHCSNAGYADYI